MAQLSLGKREINTVFDLVGDKENDITKSLGWALAQSDVFVKRFLKDLFPHQTTGMVTAIHLQKHGDEQGGYTDIEIETDEKDKAHLIVEAKRAWNLPEKSQLQKYVPRFGKNSRNAIVVMAEREPTNVILPKAVKSVPIHYRSWKQVTKMAWQSISSGDNAEKRLLREFAAYMEGLMNMQHQESNRVYVIPFSSADEIQHWSGTSWRKYVTENRLFFQDVYDTAPWPPEPPNYLGFRYKSKLLSIHHVDKYERVEDLLHNPVPVLHRKSWMKDPHHKCALGPPIYPKGEVRSTGLQRGRVWAALDLLLTCKTIRAACKKTKKRIEQ